ncbi:MAG: phage terminase large subunit [Thermodesulfobacteriota bacterium]
MSEGPLHFDLGDTQGLYANSEAVVNLIYSNTGEGKTFASVAGMVKHAKRCGKPIRCAVVRDTHENIKTSTARSIIEIFEEHPHLIKFRNDFKQLTIYSKPRVDCDLFGIDDLGSLSKLQGPEYALIWLEEPAPMADRVNAGLSEEVFNAALVRCTRQKGARPRLQISMNPADEEHWTFKRIIEPEVIDPDNPLITKAVFRIEPGENPYVSETSRQAVRAAYKHDQASFMRYALGQFAPIYRGAKVTPEYNPYLHLSPIALEPAAGLVSFRLWDSWHNPCCILGQITSIGRLIFIDVLRLENSDIRILANTQVRPLLESPRWKNKARAWRDVGDFTMRQPDQSNRQETAARVIEDAFNTRFEPGPHKWDIIKLGLKNAFGMNIQGLPAIQINPQAKLLHRALAGAWHYKTDNSGNIVSNVPEKDEASHVGDCFANGVCVLLPTIGTKASLATYRRLAQQTRRRVQTYAIGGTR